MSLGYGWRNSMARVLHSGEWFEQLSTEALYEEEYEKLLVQHAKDLFPLYYLVPFKTTVAAEMGSAKPDFALVHRGYREWWVVEAELSHHRFEGHVRPQIEILSRATYSEREADYLHARRPALDLRRLRAITKGSPPGVLVVVNAPRPEWARELKRYGALLTILEVFRSGRNRYLYRLNGEQPEGSGRQASICTAEVPRMLRLRSPGILRVAVGERLLIRFRDGISAWTRLDIQDGVYLVSGSPISLDSRKRYELVETEDGSFTLTLVS
jgi:hypothetical protein